VSSHRCVAVNCGLRSESAQVLCNVFKRLPSPVLARSPFLFSSPICFSSPTLFSYSFSSLGLGRNQRGKLDMVCADLIEGLFMGSEKFVLLLEESGWMQECVATLAVDGLSAASAFTVGCGQVCM